MRLDAEKEQEIAVASRRNATSVRADAENAAWSQMSWLRSAQGWRIFSRQPNLPGHRRIRRRVQEGPARSTPRAARTCADSSPPSVSRVRVIEFRARRHDPERQRHSEDARLHAGGSARQASQHVRRAGLRPQPRVRQAVLGKARPRRIRRRPLQADRQGRQGDLDSGELQRDPRSQRPAVQGREIRHRHHRAEDARHGRRGPARRHQQGAGGHRVHARRQDHDRKPEFPERAGLHARRNPRPASRHVRRPGLSRRAPNIASSGRSSGAASSTPTSTSGSARAARRSGFRQATIRSSMPTARRSRSSNTPPTSPPR